MKEKELFWYCLNPYFPGFIFLISVAFPPDSAHTGSLNPYFPGFIFLIKKREVEKMGEYVKSQSLFSWIHLSYGRRKIK